jgi:hypothetical protein
MLGRHPGLTATQFAALFWPHLRKVGKLYPAHLAAEFLGKLRRKGIVFRRIEPTNYHRGGPIPPKGRYYLKDFGFAVYEYWERQRKG